MRGVQKLSDCRGKGVLKIEVNNPCSALIMILFLFLHDKGYFKSCEIAHEPAVSMTHRFHRVGDDVAHFAPFISLSASCISGMSDSICPTDCLSVCL